MVGINNKRVNVVVYQNLYNAYKKKAIDEGTDPRFLYKKLDELMRTKYLPYNKNLLINLNNKIVKIYNFPLPIKTTITLTEFGIIKRSEIINRNIDYSLYINALLYLYVFNRTIRQNEKR